jgi:hypothetical protein
MQGGQCWAHLFPIHIQNKVLLDIRNERINSQVAMNYPKLLFIIAGVYIK